MTISGFTTKGKERELQTRKEQAKGRKATTMKTLIAEQKKGRNAAKVSARKQEKALKAYYAKEKRLARLEKEDVERENWRTAFRPDPLPVDPNVALPKAVQKVVDVANAHYQPHTRISLAFEVLFLDPAHAGNILSRITDGISDAIKIILAQHSLRPLPNWPIKIESVGVQPKQKEVTNGE